MSPLIGVICNYIFLKRTLVRLHENFILSLLKRNFVIFVKEA